MGKKIKKSKIFAFQSCNLLILLPILQAIQTTFSTPKVIDVWAEESESSVSGLFV
jgi:hypothetical protein